VSGRLPRFRRVMRRGDLQFAGPGCAAAQMRQKPVLLTDNWRYCGKGIINRVSVAKRSISHSGGKANPRRGVLGLSFNQLIRVGAMRAAFPSFWHQRLELLVLKITIRANESEKERKWARESEQRLFSS
jgi:hypothetical protein